MIVFIYYLYIYNKIKRMSKAYIWHDIGSGYRPTSIKIDANSLEEAREIVQTDYESHIYLEGPFSCDEKPNVVIDHVLKNEPSEVKPYSRVTRASFLDG